jgi:hypothetical protein
MMNDSEKELREAMAYLDQARANFDAIRTIQRAMTLGLPVEITLRTDKATFTALCPIKGSEKILDKLTDQASSRLSALEQQEAFWCQEVAALNNYRRLTETLRDNPDESHTSIEAKRREAEMTSWRANDHHMNERRAREASTDADK